jgi:hypothetical protein
MGATTTGGFFRQTALAMALALAVLGTGQAQVETDERALIRVKDGISISDSLFLLNLRFRMQNRAGFTTRAGDNLAVEEIEARVRRLRLRFDGYVLTPKLQYYIQLAFSRADQDLETGEIAQTVRDAIIYYTFTDRFYVGFGQAKLPGNRQRVISSGNLQFADRSLANALFTLDRDFGLFGYYTQPIGDQRLLLKSAISTGDGRNALAIDNGLAYTGRVEWLPLGAFRDNGDYSEGDLAFEPLPKLSLAFTYSHNRKAGRTGGQLGAALPLPSDINTRIGDLMFKYNGWAVLAEYFGRRASRPVSAEADSSGVRYVYEGTGFNGQLGRMIGRKTELAGRYTRVVPRVSIASLTRPAEEVQLGVTHYLRGHRIKAQAHVGYRWYAHRVALSAPGNYWMGMVQIEFGI